MQMRQQPQRQHNQVSDTHCVCSLHSLTPMSLKLVKGGAIHILKIGRRSANGCRCVTDAPCVVRVCVCALFAVTGFIREIAACCGLGALTFSDKISRK